MQDALVLALPTLPTHTRGGGQDRLSEPVVSQEAWAPPAGCSQGQECLLGAPTTYFCKHIFSLKTCSVTPCRNRCSPSAQVFPRRSQREPHSSHLEAEAAYNPAVVWLISAGSFLAFGPLHLYLLPLGSDTAPHLSFMFTPQ